VTKVNKIYMDMKIFLNLHKIRLIGTFIITGYLFFSCNSDKNDKFLTGIIPEPLSLEKLNGKFTLTHSISVLYNNDNLKSTTDWLSVKFRNFAGIETKLIADSKLQSVKKGIYLKLDTTLTDLGSEGYNLIISPKKIEIIARTTAGVFYGIQSLLQLMAININEEGKILDVPAVIIKDYPRFSWRGMHLDVSRHFEDKEFIKKYLDILAAYKINTFHWHLTDDQGWRIAIEKYPLLTEIGAWRVDRTDEPWDYDQEITSNKSKKLYGGFYTKEDIREIVDYAANLHITIVPEIEMPGHSQAAMTAYPQLACSGKPYRRPSDLPFEFTDPYCAGNDSTFIFLDDVLTEVMELFPSEYMHIGGDEAKKTPWTTCPKCKALMKREGIKNVEELQSYFIKKIEKFLENNGRKLIGWDEILEGGLAPGAAVMSWRGEEGGIEAASMGHHVVMTPWKYMYFNAYQDSVEAKTNRDDYILDLEEVYTYDPVPGKLNDDQKKFVMGVQACLWSENIQTPDQAERHTLPRLCALSEVAWSSPERKNFDDFRERLKKHYALLDRMGVNYYRR
jgi:hexosaminidase